MEPGERPPRQDRASGPLPAAEPVRVGGRPGLGVRVVAVAVAVVLVGGLVAAQLWPSGRSLISLSPLGTPSPPTSAIAVSSSPSPTPFRTLPFPTVPPSAPPTPPLDGIPTVAWGPQAASRALADDLLVGTAAEGGWGPFVYAVRGGRLDVVDLRTHGRREALLPLLAREGVATMAVDGDLVAVLAGRGGLQPRPGQVGGCGSSTPLSWRLLAAPVGADGSPSAFEVVTTGTTRRIFTDPVGPPCTGPWSNLIAVTGARIVIAEEAPTAVDPWASTIHVFDLGGPAGLGPSATAISVPGVVYSLSAASSSLSAAPGLIAWTATSGAPPDGAGNQPTPTWSVGYDLGGASTPVVIAAAGPTQGWLPLPAVAADDGVVWWGGTTISAD